MPGPGFQWGDNLVFGQFVQNYINMKTKLDGPHHLSPPPPRPNTHTQLNQAMQYVPCRVDLNVGFMHTS